jgi:poly(beta-D-mannuronate) lyase
MIKYLLAIFLSLNVAYAAEYKVTSADEIKSVLKKVTPGDVIIMKNGNWTDQKILFEADGTEEKPIVLRAEEPGKVILTGSSTLRIAGDYLIVEGLYFKDGAIDKGSVIEFRKGSEKESNFSRLTNCAVVNYNPPDINTDYKWISLYGTYNRVDHCYTAGKNHSGTTLVVWLSDQPNYHLIDSNYFGYRPDLGFNGGETIRVGTSHWSMYDSYTTVENNFFENCSGEREIISNKSCGNIYRYNTFRGSAGTLTLRHGNNCTVESNFFFGDDEPMSGGVRVIGEDHKVINNYFYGLRGDDVFSAIPIMNGVPDSPLNRYFRVKNAVIAFNTFIDCRYNIVIGTGADEELSLVPENSIIANNVFLNSENPVVTFITQPENFRWEGNIYYNAEPGISDKGMINSDPELSEEENNFRKIQSSSSIIDKAEGMYDFIKTDIEGHPRKGKKDIGCDEYSDEEGGRAPLTGNSVGPEWMRK